jgi:hypothetical protein
MGINFGATTDEKPFIDFDILKIKGLKDEYDENITFVLGELPLKVNWNSQPQVKSYFRESFGIELENVKIEHVFSHMEKLDHDSPAFDVINGFLLYLKYSYILKNYINCILRHEESGRIMLRHFQGQWVLPNRRPLSGSPEIKSCITHTNHKE